jgi:hypothetical protein
MPPEAYIAVLITLAVVAAVFLLVLLVLGGGSLARLGLARQAFRRVLRDPAVAEKVRPLVSAEPAETKPARLSGEPVRLLAILQRDARLLDFLLEDLSQATEEQLVAGVRQIHPKARQAIQEHLSLEPVLPQREGDPVEVPPGFDPSAVRLTGNVTGQPPFRGTLQHHGWRVKAYNLPAPPAGQDDLIVAPAEVELP